MASASCKKCGKAIQDSFVFVDNANEPTTQRNRSIASLNQTLKAKHKLEELVTNATKPRPNRNRSESLSIGSAAQSFHRSRSHSLPPSGLEDTSGPEEYSTAVASDNSRPSFSQRSRSESESRPDSEEKSKKEEKEICFDCTGGLLQELNQQLQEAEMERKAYLNFLEENKRPPHELLFLDSEAGNLSVSELTDTLTREIKELQSEEAALQTEYEQLDNEYRNTRNELETLEETSKTGISQLNQRCWNGVALIQQKMADFVEERETLAGKRAYGLEELKKLEQTNVYQDTFYINTKESVANINNFRLGRLPEVPVPWDEINAAWGEATLLLYIISRKTSFMFSKYRLRASGSRSTIETIANGAILELYGSDDLGFGSWLSWPFYKKSTFDDGMVAFLFCLSEMGTFAEKRTVGSKPTLPYQIQNDKIDGCSIKMQSNTEVYWTKALRNALSNLNFLLAWVSGHPKIPPP
eukprot:TRINITY_DN6814_c0_g1_i1.p1 TRINITY_DN6814_c0_g1~~TRINITY_DN6814_c0_g1_i1.p1  ORF type:complete len:469 (-),score=107.88 TRINITY_DN6814_c0_g1_i1:51-1457(-)